MTGLGQDSRINAGLAGYRMAGLRQDSRIKCRIGRMQDYRILTGLAGYRRFQD